MKNKIYIFRKNFIWTCFASLIFTVILIILIIGLITGNIDDFKGTILAAIGILGLDLFMLWSIARNKYQYIKLTEKGVSVGSFLGETKHIDWNEIKNIYVNTFQTLPQVKFGERLRGMDSITSMPRKIPNKWIVFDDGQCTINLKNIYSYLVPIRKNMVIKVAYNSKIFELINKYYKKDLIDLVTEKHSFSDLSE